MKRYTDPSVRAPDSAPLSSLQVALLLTSFLVASIAFGTAAVIAWPTRGGLFMGMGIFVFTCAVGGVVTAMVFRRDRSPAEQELIP
jgi:hypothetical protein